MNKFINTFLGCAVAMMMVDIGYDFTTWQWWVAVLAVALNYANGRYHEIRMQGEDLLRKITKD